MTWLLERIEGWLFLSPLKVFLPSLYLVMILKSGIWFIPNIGATSAIAENPFVNPFADPNAHYLMWNWLGPLLLWLLGASGNTACFVFYLVCSLGFSAIFSGLVFYRLSDIQARTALTLFAVLPVSTTAYYWVGYDSLTLLLMVAALACARRPWLVFPVAVALGLQHFEQSFVSAGALFMALVLSGHRNRNELPFGISFSMILMTGSVVGKLLLVILFEIHDVQVNSGRAHWWGQHIWLLVEQFYFGLPQIAFAVLGIGWLIVLKYVDAVRHRVAFFTVFAGLFALMPFVADQTRVFAVVSFPLLTCFWLLNSRFLSVFSTRDVALFLLVWLIVPYAWSWSGVPQPSVLPFDMAYVTHELWGFPVIPGNPALWPFELP